jgi:hypothetical protein
MRRIAGLLVLFTAVLRGPDAARGFELLRVNGDPCSAAQNLSWAERAVAVSSVHLPTEFQQASFEARTRWNQSVPGFEFRGGAAPSCTVDGIANLEFSDRPCGGDPSDFSGIVAITRSVWRQNGELVDADVLFNVNGPAARDHDIFLEVALHELGHVLGLDHSDSCGRSGVGTLMKTFLGPVRLLFPQADDVDGAQFIYPNGTGGTVPEGANSCALTPAGQGRLPAAPFLAIPLLLFLRRGLTRRAARKTIDEPRNLL